MLLIFFLEYSNWRKALRVLLAETRLTVYRQSRVFSDISLRDEGFAEFKRGSLHEHGFGFRLCHARRGQYILCLLQCLSVFIFIHFDEVLFSMKSFSFPTAFCSLKLNSFSSAMPFSSSSRNFRFFISAVRIRACVRVRKHAFVCACVGLHTRARVCPLLACMQTLICELSVQCRCLRVRCVTLFA